MWLFLLRNRALWVAETSSGDEVVDSAGFVLKLISHVRDFLSAPTLPVVLVASQTRTGPGEFSPSAPNRGPQTEDTKAKAPLVGSMLVGDVEESLARMENTIDDLS